jgi:WD40 repeat protein
MLWDADTGQQRRKLQGHHKGILGLAFAANHHELISASLDDTVKRWLPNTKPFREIRGLVVISQSAKLGLGLLDWVDRAAVTPDGRRVLIGDSQGVRLWDLELGQEIYVLADTPRRDANGVAGFWGMGLSADGTRGIAGGADGVAHIWDLNSGKELQTFRGHTASIWGALLLPDGRRAATGSWDRSIRLWDIATGKELRQFTGVDGKVRSLALSPDGKLLAAALVSADADPGHIGLFDIELGSLVRTLRGYAAATSSVAFSPDGKRLLTGSFDKIIRLWDLSTGKEVKRFEGHTAATGATFSKDGAWVISWSDDQDATIRFWDVATGKQLFCSRPYHKGLLNMVVLPDGQHALATDKDGMVHLWEWGRREGS